MSYELYGRVCVGAPLRPEAGVEVYDDFIRSLGLAVDASSADIFSALRADTPKHKLHEPDRVRYERALEAFIDAKWDADFAIGGRGDDGLFDRRRGFLFVGVRVEQFEITVTQLPTGAASIERPQWLRKGDLSVGSDLAHSLGEDARKPWEHAARAYSRAAKDILKDAVARVKSLPVSKQHDPDWALCRWVVDSEHESVQQRHGNRTR